MTQKTSAARLTDDTGTEWRNDRRLSALLSLERAVRTHPVVIGALTIFFVAAIAVAHLLGNPSNFPLAMRKAAHRK